MRAAYVDRLGPPSQIRVGELAGPIRRPGQILVQVEASTVNPVDTFVRSGRFRTKVELPFIVGRDCLGTVEEPGEDSPFSEGQRVLCTSLGHAGRQGAACQLVAVDPDRLYPVPDGIDSDVLLAVAHPGSTAHLAVVTHGEVNAGNTVVVRGAAGNVGSAAVTIAADLGARVVAVCAERDAEYCKMLGATVVIDRHAADADEQLADVVSHDGVAVWIDAHGGNELATAVELLGIGGRIVVLAGAASRPMLPAGALYLKDAQIRGFVISRASVGDLRQAAANVARLVAARRLAPRRLRYAGLDQLADLHALMEAGGLSGERVIVRTAV